MQRMTPLVADCTVCVCVCVCVCVHAHVCGTFSGGLAVPSHPDWHHTPQMVQWWMNSETMKSTESA